MKRCTFTGLACVAVMLAQQWGATARGAEKVTGKDVTDEQVVAAMTKGIDFLLAAKKNDTWEITHPQEMYKGGETALVVYSLLNAGESLQDNPNYHSKLHWRSAEMAPAIAWLSKNNPGSTYAAGLEASALTLVPKMPDTKPGEGSQQALDECKAYLIEALGADGGYTYVSRLYQYVPEPGKVVRISDLWRDYCEALRGNDKAKTTAARQRIDGYREWMAKEPGGEKWGFLALIAELKAKKRDAAAGGNAAQVAEMDAEMKELENYINKATPIPPAKGDHAAAVAGAKKRLDELIGYRKAAEMPDPQDYKKKIPVVAADLEKMIVQAEEYLKRTDLIAKNNFDPLGDLSNGQYGALGSWALVDFGMEMPNSYWTRTDHFWRLEQTADGGWPYSAMKKEKPDLSTDSMTMAGVASLYICQEFLDTELRTVPRPDKNIDAGLAWITKNFKPEAASAYCMYGLERVGRSSGLKFFGTTNWYREGAANLINKQGADGSWSGGWAPTVDTSYALLFLARGRNPVVFNKLQYNGYWNARAHDSAYLTRWMSKRLEKPINWQVVNLQVNPEEWLDAPILLITGSVDPKFSREDVGKLKRFVDAGGMIFSTSDGASAGFTAAMKHYAEQITDKKYEMRTLPRNHELFSKEMSADLPNPPPLLGMSNGVREVWIHSAQDLGADWQMRRTAMPGKTSFEVGTALYYYASGMGSLRSKLQPLAVAEKDEPAARTVEVSRVDYPGNADPEPGAWGRFAKLARAHFKTVVNVSTVKIADLDAKKSPLAHLTGTTKVTFTDEDAAGLKKYLDGGGMLFMDAAGGNVDFAASCRELVKKIYPAGRLEPLPPDHPIYAGNFTDGVAIGEVDFRKYGNVKLKRRVTTPWLEAVVLDGKVKVLFSQWDICSGFLGTTTWGIVGYSPASSEALGRNIVIYATKPELGVKNDQ